jgi:hypothetical protein
MVGMGSALGKWGGERESGVEKNGRKNASSSPVLCVSRGRRRLMVPFKSAPFAYSLFFLNCAVSPKTRHLKWCQNVSILIQSFNLCFFSILVLGFGFLQSIL